MSHRFLAYYRLMSVCIGAHAFKHPNVYIFDCSHVERAIASPAPVIWPLFRFCMGSKLPAWSMHVHCAHWKRRLCPGAILPNRENIQAGPWSFPFYKSTSSVSYPGSMISRHVLCSHSLEVTIYRRHLASPRQFSLASGLFYRPRACISMPCISLGVRDDANVQDDT